MGARELVVGRHVFSVSGGWRRSLVAGRQQAPASDVFPRFRAVSSERPGFVARRTDPGDGRLFRADEQLRPLGV